jgi:hypothetical protein
LAGSEKYVFTSLEVNAPVPGTPAVKLGSPSFTPSAEKTTEGNASPDKSANRNRFFISLLLPCLIFKEFSKSGRKFDRAALLTDRFCAD